MRALISVLLATSMVGCLASVAAADRFTVLQIGDIKGEHDEGDFAGLMPVAAFEHNIPGRPEPPQLSPGSSFAGTQATYTPPANHEGSVITMEVDKYAWMLMRASARGRAFPVMKVSLCDRAGRETARWALFTLKDVRITSMTLLAPGHGERPAGVALDTAVVVMALSWTSIAQNFEEIKVT